MTEKTIRDEIIDGLADSLKEFGAKTLDERCKVLKRLGILNEHGQLARRYRECEPTKVIFIDGFDYVGKSTLIEELKEYLRSQGNTVKVLKFPTQDLIDSETKEQMIKGATKLSYSDITIAAFRQDIWVHIERTLDENEHDYILCDRGLTTSIVYQFFMQNPEVEFYDLLGRYAMNQLEGEYISLEMRHEGKAEFLTVICSAIPEVLCERRKKAGRFKDDMDYLSDEEFLAAAEKANAMYHDVFHSLAGRSSGPIKSQSKLLLVHDCFLHNIKQHYKI